MKLSLGRLLLALGALIALSGCASIGPPEAPSLELPKPPTDLHAARKGDKVTFTWTIPQRTTDRQSVRYLGKTEICRGIATVLKQCGTPVRDVAPPASFESKKKPAGKLTATFVDTLPAAAEQEYAMEFASYAVEVLNTAGRGAGLSNQVRVALVPTVAPFADFSATVSSKGVTISWQCPNPAEGRNGIKYLFRIYRRLESSSRWNKVIDADATQCVEGASGGSSSFLDQTFEWEKIYFYRGTAVSVIETAGKPAVEVEGDDTPEVKVFAHDVFPPAVPSGLQAVFSGPGQLPFIDLIWAPVSDADLAGYNVYRHEAGSAPVKMNSELVRTPAFRNMQVVPGKTYFYSVSAVDERGNESGRSEEASESVP
ncbi:MAG: fibronectin type III domain-containing protein [Candidatus Sulfotelmatobacter sp.]